MRLPRRGFSNAATRVDHTPIQLADAIKRVKGDVISFETLQKVGMIHNGQNAKLVSGATAKVTRKLTVSVRVTASAKAAIEAAGGKVV